MKCIDSFDATGDYTISQRKVFIFFFFLLSSSPFIISPSPLLFSLLFLCIYKCFIILDPETNQIMIHYDRLEGAIAARNCLHKAPLPSSSISFFFLLLPPSHFSSPFPSFVSFMCRGSCCDRVRGSVSNGMGEGTPQLQPPHLPSSRGSLCHPLFLCPL